MKLGWPLGLWATRDRRKGTMPEYHFLFFSPGKLLSCFLRGVLRSPDRTEATAEIDEIPVPGTRDLAPTSICRFKRYSAVEGIFRAWSFSIVSRHLQCTKLQIEIETAMNIYVGNLPYSVTDADLRETFAPFGDVSSVQLISDKFTGESKGFGFVEMNDNSQADAAIKSLNGSPLKGRNITVNQAKPKSDRPARGRGPRY